MNHFHFHRGLSSIHLAITPLWLLFAALSMGNNALAQTVEVLAISGVYRDTVTVGFTTDATLGVDPHLGEHAILSPPAPHLDLRVLQRDSQGFECLYTGYPNWEAITFDLPFDAKSNFRPVGSTGGGLFFEIHTNSDSARNMIIRSSQDLFTILDRILVSTDSCTVLKSEIPFNPFGVPLMVHSISSAMPIHSIIIQFAPAILNTFGAGSRTPSLKAHPNPSSDFIHLSLDGLPHATSYNVHLFSSDGRLVMHHLYRPGVGIPIDRLPTGIYVVKVESGGAIHLGRFVKM